MHIISHLLLRSIKIRPPSIIAVMLMHEISLNFGWQARLRISEPHRTTHFLSVVLQLEQRSPRRATMHEAAARHLTRRHRFVDSLVLHNPPSLYDCTRETRAGSIINCVSNRTSLENYIFYMYRKWLLKAMPKSQ